jgi:hypothetical protein
MALALITILGQKGVTPIHDPAGYHITSVVYTIINSHLVEIPVLISKDQEFSTWISSWTWSKYL